MVEVCHWLCVYFWKKKPVYILHKGKIYKYITRCHQSFIHFAINYSILIQRLLPGVLLMQAAIIDFERFFFLQNQIQTNKWLDNITSQMLIYEL